MLQLPLASVTALPISVLPSYSLTVVPASEVPLKVGWLSSVTSPFCRKPVYGPTSSKTLSMVGTAGPTVTTVKLYFALGAVVLPAGSRSTAVSSLTPEIKGAVGVSDQWPLASTMALPT